MEDLSPCSPPPIPGPPGPADRIRGGSTSGDLFWSPNSQGEPLGPPSTSQPSPPPAPPVGSEGMAVDFPPGIGDQSVWAISLKATEEGLGDDLSAAIRSLEYINTWLTWSVAQRRSVPDVDSDALASCILALSSNTIANGLFAAAAQRAPADSNLLFRISSTVEELVNIPGVLAFTTASEALARAASRDKGKEKEPLVPGPSCAPSPCPQCSSRCPPAKPIMPVKLTAARVAALAAHLPAPTPLGKRKHPSKEKALVFPSANPSSLTNAQAAVSGDPPRITPAEAARTKQKRYTTHGQSRHQVVVYVSPPIVWKVDKVTNQINDLLVKSKRTVRVSSVSETQGTLSLETTIVPDAADLKVFESLFANAQKAPDGKLQCKVPTSKSCLKICDFPYHGLKPTRGDHGRLLPVPGTTLYEILMKSPLGGMIHLYKGHPPRLSRNSRTSD